jgi:hypothetical protein
MVIFVILFAFLLLLSASFFVFLQERKGRADVQTFDGRQKFFLLGYDFLVLERYRVTGSRRGYYTDKDYRQIPLDAPDRKQEKNSGLVMPEPLKTMGCLRGFGNNSFFTSDLPFDDLRLYGFKEGLKRLVFRYSCYKENSAFLKNFVEKYNSERI